jgi:NAD(P)-dependent dehydrogenase (short-subunit alcohol dehydrogenase family)
MPASTILITGANSFIGSYLAHRFFEEDVRLLLVYHSQTNRIADLISHTDSVFACGCDLTKGEQTRQEIQKLITVSGYTPTALVHLATLRSSDSLSLLDSNPSQWENILNSNVMTAYHVLQAVLPSMKSANFGRIVLFGSDVSRRGLANGSAYAASKAAIANLGISLAAETAPWNILVNTISPGPVETDYSQFSTEYAKFRQQYFKKEKEMTPLQRSAKPEDIYPICHFLVSADNTYLTGEEIFLTGGKKC